MLPIFDVCSSYLRHHYSIGKYLFLQIQIVFHDITVMVTYSIKQLMGLCSDYALDAQIQKILFSLDLWVPKAARVCPQVKH